jgi:TRAP-type C4-dicarboxylate transport system permease small subunit
LSGTTTGRHSIKINSNTLRVLKPARLLAATERVLLAFGAVAVAMLALLTMADVTGRYVFVQPIPGTYEVTQLMLVAIVFTGIAAVQAAHAHIRVEILLNRIRRRRFRVALELLALACGVAAFTLIGWQGWLDFLRAWCTHDYTMGLIEFPTWPVKVWIPLGSAVICFRLLHQITQEIRKLVRE